jgi:hypothetical protein
VSPDRSPVLTGTRDNGPAWLLNIHDSYRMKERVSSWFIIYLKAVEYKEKSARLCTRILPTGAHKCVTISDVQRKKCTLVGNNTVGLCNDNQLDALFIFNLFR